MSKKKQIEKYLKENPGLHRVFEVARETGVSPSHTSTVLAQIEERYTWVERAEGKGGHMTPYMSYIPNSEERRRLEGVDDNELRCPQCGSRVFTRA